MKAAVLTSPGKNLGPHLSIEDVSTPQPSAGQVLLRVLACGVCRTELHIVETMHERKRMMAERADAFLALPGGIGTFEELFEVWTWRQLGYHDKPVGLLNVDGYYDGLLAFLGATVEQQFLSDWQMDLIQTDVEPLALLRRLVQDAGLSPTPQLTQI